MRQDYADKYDSLEQNHWWFRARLQILRMKAQEIKATNKSKPLRILNIGVASGASSEMLTTIGEVTSLEFDIALFDKLKINKPHLVCVQGSIENLPFEDDAFDLVCAFDVIEHVADDKKAAEEMSRVLKSTGQVFVTVPAFMFLWSNHDRINHHFRRYTRRGLLQVLSPFTDFQTTYFNFILFFLIAPIRILQERIFNHKRETISSDFEKLPNPAFQFILYNIFVSEKLLLRIFRVLPLGVSLMLIANNSSKDLKNRVINHN